MIQYKAINIVIIIFFPFDAGVNHGNWYFEVRVNEMQNESAARIGWSLALGK